VDAPDEAARRQVASMLCYEPQLRPAFATPAWVRDAVFYQIFPDRFARGESAHTLLNVQPWGSPPTNNNFMGGNLQGILDRLDYLVDLGVTALYLTPIFQSPSNHRYDIMDYFAVDPHLGDMELLQRLVSICHLRGLRVVLDGVFNHCSDQHPFFVDVKRQGRQSRYWDWFHIRNWPIPDHFDSQQKALHWYDCWWGFHTLPKLNYHHPDVQEYFLKVATYWLREADIDSWRLDVPNEVLQSFWPKFRRAVKAVKPDAYIVGEIWDDATSWLQGDQFDAVMNYRFQRSLIGCFAEERMDTRAFDGTLREILQAYPEPAAAVMLNLLGSHDTVRPMTIARWRDSDARHALESLKLMAAMQFTFLGAPCVYYGDEIGLQGEKDPDCRRCFPWGGSSRTRTAIRNQSCWPTTRSSSRSARPTPRCAAARFTHWRRTRTSSSTFSSVVAPVTAVS
jgi:glycosidase